MAYTSDVIVVGLGGLGSAACHHLATRGLRVVGVDQFQPAHARGASHGETRGVWQAYFMGPGYVPFLQRAYELWGHLAELRGEPFFHRTGGICLGPADGELVPAALASAKTCGLPHEYLDAAEVRRRFPTFTPAEDDVAVFDASSGYVRPELVIQAHIDLADKAGAILRFGEAVVECATTSSGVRVRTAAETYEADKLVVAAGAWIPKLFPQLTLPIQVLRKVMLWFDPIKGPEDFLPPPKTAQTRSDSRASKPRRQPASTDGPERRRSRPPPAARRRSAIPVTPEGEEPARSSSVLKPKR